LYGKYAGTDLKLNGGDYIIATQVVSTLAGTGSSGLVNGAGDSAQFNAPIDVAMSPDGTYALVTDFSNHVIRAVGTAS
jgi:hypothetical protein